MAKETLKSAQPEPVKQFSIFTENKVGRLIEIIKLFADREIHVVALTVLDTTDSSILRMVVDDPDGARQVLREQGIVFVETDLLVVEFDAATDLQKILAALLQAEINIHYTYSFLVRPKSKSALAMHLEDTEIGTQVLMRQGFRVLVQGDISR
ncbi:MAG: acetolactate synthase [Methylacidiphilales bacterium]|nr:acetolactate synthase [Candidatus Methylacidiphilales bacterium]